VVGDRKRGSGDGSWKGGRETENAGERLYLCGEGIAGESEQKRE